MKLFLTIAFLACSILLQEQTMASLRTRNVPAAGKLQKVTASHMLDSFIQPGIMINELSCCDDDDDEFANSKKKVQALRSANNGLLFTGEYSNSIIYSRLLNNFHSLPGTDKCIFQRVLRV